MLIGIAATNARAKKTIQDLTLQTPMPTPPMPTYWSHSRKGTSSNDPLISAIHRLSSLPTLTQGSPARGTPKSLRTFVTEFLISCHALISFPDAAVTPMMSTNTIKTCFGYIFGWKSVGYLFKSKVGIWKIMTTLLISIEWELMWITWICDNSIHFLLIWKKNIERKSWHRALLIYFFKSIL